ncbi:MAG: NAD-dependent epimerase/dehydratase family protein [Clostridiales Family XIII bacterium]|jgi:UDP-glucose 4-epimerase|nr:NAD-dependent epimerase/dehydratase family protein [Clostridiales Family XIII bacterium]
MKVLITGGAGFIGSRLAERLYKSNYEVVLLDNFSYGRNDNLIFDDLDLQKSVIRLDIRDKEALEKIFKENIFDYIYHIAAISPLPDCQNNPAEAVEVNVTGTVNVFELARKYGTNRVLFSSTSSVYENIKELPSREDMVIQMPSLVYPITKFQAEIFARGYFDVYNVPVTVFRFGNVYGPAMDFIRKFPPAAAAFIKNLYHDKPPIIYDTGKQARDFIYTEDLLNLITLAMQGEGFDILNVGTGTQNSINEMANQIARIMGKEDIKPLYKDAAVFWDSFPQLFKGKYQMNKKYLIKETVKPVKLSMTHAKEKYNYESKYSFYEGLKKTVEKVSLDIEKYDKKING